MAPERSEHDETAKFSSDFELAEPRDAVQHRAALDEDGRIAATDLAQKTLRDHMPEVIMPEEKSRETLTLIEQAVGDRKDIAQYVFRYLVTKPQKLAEIMHHVRRNLPSDKIDSFYRIIISLGGDIKSNPKTGDPVAIEFPPKSWEQFREKADIEPMPLDRLWKKARIVETEVRNQFGEQEKISQLELSVSLKDWRTIQPPEKGKRSNEAIQMAKDLETFLETTYVYDTGCIDAPMKWYTTLTPETLGVLAPSPKDKSMREILSQAINPMMLKALYSEKGLSSESARVLGGDKTINEVFDLKPPKKKSGDKWIVIQGNHGYTGFGDLMKIPTDRIAHTVSQSLDRSELYSPGETTDAATARVLASIDRALGNSKQRPKPRVWNMVMDGMGINGNMAPAEMRALNPNIEDTYDCYANQIDFASTIAHSSIEAGWSMGGWACILALMKKLQAAEHIKGKPLTQEEVDAMEGYLPYTIAITPAMAETCWFSMVTPSQIEERNALKNPDTITPPLDTYLTDLKKKNRLQRAGFFISRNMLGLGSIMHKINGGRVEPLKTTFEFFSKLYTGKIFPKDAQLTSDEEWIQTAALAHAEGFTHAGNGPALDWQRHAINHTRRPEQRGVELLRMARGYLAEFVGNQDLLVRDKDLWREINDQAVEAPAFELPAGHALLGQDCFQEFPFAIGVLTKPRERRQMQDAVIADANEPQPLYNALRVFEGGSYKRHLANEFMNYGKKYNVRYPKKAA